MGFALLSKGPAGTDGRRTAAAGEWWAP